MIYLDYQATTPLAPEAREAMLRWLGGPGSDGFGNPSSPHKMGRIARAAVEVARDQVAALLPPGGRVIFTSGATEAINLAIRGTAGKGGRVACSAIEHAAVLDTADHCGGRVTIPVDADGIAQVASEIPDDVRLIAVMQVNNEVGTVQPVAEWRQVAAQKNKVFLCDAVQSYGKLSVCEADLIAISAHKFHGPKAAGALWVRDGIELAEVQTGGGQEHGLRSGTLSPALIAGMGAAAAVAEKRMAEDASHVETLGQRARDVFSRWIINGSTRHRWPGNLNIRLQGLDANRLISDCRTVMFSSGSACASGSGRGSHVLRAMSLSEAEARSSIRLGFGRYTTLAEIEEAGAIINAAAEAQGL